MHLIVHSFLSLPVCNIFLVHSSFINGSGYSATDKCSHQLFDFFEYNILVVTKRMNMLNLSCKMHQCTCTGGRCDQPDSDQCKAFHQPAANGVLHRCNNCAGLYSLDQAG